jgi:flavin reductase (DIM6/NTAB) family NADH-FMN oxidoreductase RutF
VIWYAHGKLTEAGHLLPDGRMLAHVFAGSGSGNLSLEKGFMFMDLQLKKQVLRSFTYGLYAVSCVDDGEVNAFTANWLSQVSFEPPLIAVSIENATKSLPMILRSRAFVVNVLRTDGQDKQKPNRALAGALGKSALKVPDKLVGIEYTPGPGGAPILRAALAWVACEVRHTVEAGDSTLVVGEVVDLGMLGEGQPLTMSETGFRHAG